MAIRSPHNWFIENYSVNAGFDAAQWDFNSEDLEKNLELIKASPDYLEVKTINWFIPPFEYIYYAGIHTIFRFAAYFAEKKGILNRFILVGPEVLQFDIEKMKESVGKAFPTLIDAPLIIADNEGVLKDISPCDAGIATRWETAYYLLKFNLTKKKFYFIQDYETLFYPAGSSYVLAENTYQFGFYGIANTEGLRKMYVEQYGGNTQGFTPAVDTEMFFPAVSRDTKNTDVYKVFFYARPVKSRNGFELGCVALKKLKELMGDQVQIVTAGSPWDPAYYQLDGIIENLGRLKYEETAELYRSCDIGLMLMFTRHPSYLPLQLMASGCVVVSNKNPGTEWFYKDKKNCLLSISTASYIAETIQQGLLDRDLRAQIAAIALDEIKGKYSDWAGEIEKVYKFLTTNQIY